MLEGSRGLLFTDEAPDVVSEWFASFQKADFARTGNKATETFSLPLGPVLINDEPAAHSLEPQLRKLGLSTSLLRGVPTLTAPHTVCTEGDTLNPNQVNLLKLFGKTYATVRPPLSLSRSLHARPTRARLTLPPAAATARSSRSCPSSASTSQTARSAAARTRRPRPLPPTTSRARARA